MNTTGFTYDKDGNVTGVEYPSGDNPTYSYDDQNRCYAFNGYSLLTFQGEWVTNRLLGNNLSTQYFYQPNWRVYEVWQHHGKYDPNLSTFPSSNISDRIYGYAPDSQMTWEMRQPDNGASGSALEDGRGENFEYASNGNLNGFSMLYPNTYQNTNNQDDSTANPSNFSGAPGAGGSGSYVNTYRYDGAGNRITATQMGSAAINYTADAEDRYTSFGYDANGDAVSAGTGWTYAYDAEGRMTSAVRQSDGYGIQFEYDGLGRLIYQGDAQPKIFCYAGKQRIEERAFANNVSLYRYWFDAPGKDSIVCRYSSSTGALLLYQYDAQGNTTHVSDGNGNIVEQYLYDAYGTPSVYNKAGSYLGQTSTVDNRYLFHGASAYEWVPVPGLYYCRARMYLPLHGRWLQPDPIGFKGGDVNLYRYCGNDSVNKVDPSGLDAEDLSDVVEQSYGYGDDGGYIASVGEAPTGSNIPSITYVQNGALLTSNAINGIQATDLVPGATELGGLNYVCPAGTTIADNNAIGVLGVGQGQASAQALADSQNMVVAYNTNPNFIYDVAVSTVQKIDGGEGVQNGSDLANLAGQFSSPPAIYAYSQGTLDVVDAVGQYGMQASSITYYAPAVSLPGAVGAASSAGATFGGYNQNLTDISNSYAPSVNPVGFLSSVLFPLNPSSHTNYPIYVPVTGPVQR